MNFIKRFAAVLFVTIIMFISVTLLYFALKIWDLNQIIHVLTVTYHDETLRVVLASVAVFFLALNFMFYKIFSDQLPKDRTIAFDNPTGRVNVSLSALEDVVKRRLNKFSEVHEGKSQILASKKGISVKVRINLKSEVNIPETAAKVQESVLKKIQDTIGLDEPVDVTVSVAKILPQPVKSRKASPSADAEEESDSSEPNIPFQGYRA